MIGGQHTSMFGSQLHTDWALPKPYHSPSCLQENVFILHILSELSMPKITAIQTIR